MSELDKQIKRLLKIPGVINWARQNFARTDDTARALKKLAQSEMLNSLGPIYSLCAKLAYREISYEDALSKADSYELEYLRRSGEEILPLFNDYLVQNQAEGLVEFREQRAPFPIGKRPDGKVAAIPVRPTFVTIRAGRLHPVFVLGWVNTPLNTFQCRLISAIIRRALLTQQDFLGCDAEIVSFPRHKGYKSRYRGGWLISSYPDLTDAELSGQIAIYNNALKLVIDDLRDEDADG